MPSRWKYDRPMSRAAFEARFPDEASCARHLAAKRWRRYLGMYGLREGDFGDRRHDHAPQPLAPEDLVHGRSHRDHHSPPCNSRPSSGSAVTRVPGSCYTSCAVPWSIRIAACLRTWSRSMRPPYRRTVKGPQAGKVAARKARSRRGRAIARGRATSHPAGAALRAQPSCLRCRDLGAGRAGNHRWLERLLRPARPRPPAQGRRCNARPSRADVDPSCVLEPEALGARNLPWPAPRPSAPLSRRVRVPLEPPPPHRNGLRHPARHRHAPPTRRLPRHRRTTRLIPAGRAPATARPPIHLNQGRVPALQPA